MMAELGDLMAIADEERALFLANEERYTVAMVRADTAEAEVRALREALGTAHAHVLELREAWERGVIEEHDGHGGRRSNRNVDVEVALRALLAPEPVEDAPAPAGGA